MGRQQTGGLPLHATVFLEDPPTFTEHGNVFRAEYSSGDASFAVAFTPHTLLAGIELARRAYNEWADRQIDPLRLRPKKG